MNAGDLLGSAERLLTTGPGRPADADLRRAASTIYYAAFHCLAKTCADTLIGQEGPSRPSGTWLRTYRALEHGRAKQACRHQEGLRGMSYSLREFARLFVDLQDNRHRADYDPVWYPDPKTIEDRLGVARQVIRRFESTPLRDRRDFAAHVLFKRRR